jgi:hypothetical protein
MLKTSNTQYPYEHYGDISVDFGSNYWEKLTDKYINKNQSRAVGFKFLVNNMGEFFLYIWVTPLNSQPNENGEIPLKKIKTNVTWEEFSKSFVVLHAQAFWGRQKIEDFYEIEEGEDIGEE